ncbi:ThuA domain-containing protein [Akkermansiaceae bacterium]|nr:ThuA domain-containing protein [Akkermansiaceae bacterium]MDB4537761.1 ThuA domain-containing protein [Akkermansiaceae bacterium]
MKHLRVLAPLILALALPAFFLKAEQKTPDDGPRPLKALLIAGGCCHDYVKQHEILYKGIQERANVRVDVIWTRDKSTNPPLPFYQDPDWAKGYDVIIHDECAADNKDKQVLKNILEAHKTIPAVHLHCAMHSFRQGNDLWFKHLGLQSSGHGPQEPLTIQFTDPEHPITKGMEDWVTGKEELYNNVNVFDAHPLALGHQTYKRGDKDVTNSAIVAWTNEKQGAPSFSTTIGHNNYTVEDPRYLDLVTRGLLWSCGKLNKEYLKSYTGSNVITEVKTEEKKPATSFGKPPKDATMVKLTAQSVQVSDGHYPWKAIDGDVNTRWTGDGAGMPNWLQLEFEKPATITGTEILWEKRDQWYQYKIESSLDGKSWTMAYDGSKNERRTDTRDKLDARNIKFLRVTVLKQEKGLWPALWEIRLNGTKGKLKLFPVLNKEEARKAQKVDGGGLEKSGNIKPRIVKLTAEEEAEILKDTTVPEGFQKTLFAPWQTANYPVYVAASPGGDLYVSSDGNGSLGRQPGRGRVLRLRDTDKDGRADEVTEFVRDIDSPRGLIWDHDRLYLLHPPHISVFFDRDGDGVAEESKRLISDIAFGFKDRPADHTTNGLEMGIDGWIYIAGGDFGFMKATGTDGRTLQHRGGGVIRFRPDGSGLEIFSTGTRNILGTPMSPTLDMFARDNTNDGGGWDVRFHHFTGLSDHGYPRLYKNFEKEHIHPLADYGGGSGCGSVYISEPGFPAEWNNAPFTVDWGRAGSFRHTVAPYGATFKETAAPKQFIKMNRPTDADVDGMSAVYQASWKGPATFNWAGPNQGYIARVTPKGYTPEPLPDFEKMSDEELVNVLESPSHIRRLAAQRTLIRRMPSKDISIKLGNFIQDSSKALESKIAAVYALMQTDELFKSIAQSSGHPEDALRPFVIRAIGDTKKNAFSGSSLVLEKALKSESPRTVLESIVAVARHNDQAVAPAVANHLSSDDPVIRHTAYRALAKMGAHEAAFSMIDSDNIDTRKAAAWALMRMHKKEVIDELLKRLSSEKDAAKRKPLISTLARLYHKEAEWKGDSWGTRPDTRGPYYELATWEQSERILSSLKAILDNAPAEEAAFIIEKLNKNRIPANDALKRILTLAAKDESLIPIAISQIAASGNTPSEALPLVIKGALNSDTPPAALAGAVKILIASDDQSALPATLKALVTIGYANGAGKERDAARSSFLNAPKLENHHLTLEKIAAGKPDSPEGQWAAMGVLQLASRKEGSPESKQMSLKAIDEAWADSKQRLAFIKAAAELRNPVINDRIAVALSDPDPEVAKAAKGAAGRLKIQAPGEDKTPKIATLKPAEAIAQVTKIKGDVALGQAIFTRATCNACHTVSQDEKQKGPYLGNITETYRRNELAEAILVPEKTIAQGFATNVFTLKDGSSKMGFVTDESGDSVSLRDITSAEHTFKKSEIKERTTLPNSLMPPGLMNNFSTHEMASLLSYLESLAKKK